MQPYPITVPEMSREFRHALDDLRRHVDRGFRDLREGQNELRETVKANADWIQEEKLRQARDQGKREGRGEAVAFSAKTLAILGAVAGVISGIAGTVAAAVTIFAAG